MKKFKAALSLILCAVILIFASARSDAAVSRCDKEEVVYILTDASGAVKSGYIVNIFGKGDITDYGEYKSVRMLTEDNEISHTGDMVSFRSNSDRIYYQGDLKRVTLPWRISIRYFIDGVEHTPAELAGKSGRLKIRFRVTENAEEKRGFFDNYALTATFGLNTEKCSDIASSAATIANAGKMKQLSFTAFPGSGVYATVTAKVKDFEMDAVSINCVKMNFNIDPNDFGAALLEDGISELTDAVGQLDTGAGAVGDGGEQLAAAAKKLRDGSKKLGGGTARLKNGLEQLNNGVSSAFRAMKKLKKGSGTLKSGSKSLKNSLKLINDSLSSLSLSAQEAKQLSAAMSEIKTAASTLADSAKALEEGISFDKYKQAMADGGVDIDGLKGQNESSIEQMEAQLAQCEEQVKSLTGEQKAELESRILELEKMIALISANGAAIDGAKQFIDASSAGAGELKDGLDTLKTGCSRISEATDTIAAKLDGLASQTALLKAAISALYDGADKLYGGIDKYTGGVSELTDGFSVISSGALQMSKAGGTLHRSTGTLHSGADKLYGGADKLNTALTELSGGISMLHGETTAFGEKAVDKLNGLTDMIGGTAEPISFASQKNKAVKSVQFVIKTDAIKKPEKKAEPPAPPRQLNFWQRFLQLFGIMP